MPNETFEMQIERVTRSYCYRGGLSAVDYEKYEITTAVALETGGKASKHIT